MVAILMTLEGEYYGEFEGVTFDKVKSRNPHDIGRRILPKSLILGSITRSSQSSWHWKANITRWDGGWQLKCFCRRNPHDIGRRILRWEKPRTLQVFGVAILMTLEGEYYLHFNPYKVMVIEGRNPHDIGRRILLAALNECGLFNFCRNPHDIGRRILREAPL